jgi:hypothetical protein
MNDAPEVPMTTTPTNQPPPGNLERLLGHLKENSLASRLVRASMTAADGGAASALRQAVADRLEELKQEYGRGADQQD